MAKPDLSKLIPFPDENGEIFVGLMNDGMAIYDPSDRRCLPYRDEICFYVLKRFDWCYHKTYVVVRNINFYFKPCKADDVRDFAEMYLRRRKRRLEPSYVYLREMTDDEMGAANVLEAIKDHLGHALELAEEHELLDRLEELLKELMDYTQESILYGATKDEEPENPEDSEPLPF